MHLFIKKYLAAIVAVLTLVQLPAHAAYPERPIRLVVPFGTGAPDSVARVIGQQLSVQMGQPFVVDNKPGANGILGSDIAAKAPGDGYTFLLISAAFTINPSIYKKLPFDTGKDFVPVSQLFSTEALILAVRPTLPVNSVADLIKLAKQPGSKLSYGTPGTGNSLHLVGELFNKKAGIQLTHIPYKGLGPAMNDLVSGQIDAMFLTPPLAVPFIKSGKLKALAYTNKTRASFMPDVPTIAEAGLEGMEYDGGWYGLMAPAGTPASVIATMNAEITKALKNPQVIEQAAKLNVQPIGSNSRDFRKFLEVQTVKFAEIVKSANIQAE